MNKIIIYEKLNLLTICLSLFNKYFYSKQYFMNYSNFVKVFLYPLVKILSLEQIHYVKLVFSGFYPRASIMAVEIGNNIVGNERKLSTPFIKYLRDKRAIDLVKKAYVVNSINTSVKYNILKEFVIKNEALHVCYFPANKNFIIDSLKSELPQVSIISWHNFILNLIKFGKNITNCLMLLTAPFVIMAKIIKDGRATLYFKANKAYREIIFFHRHPFVKREDANTYRDSYYFNSSILKINDCIHTGMVESLSFEKTKYLEERDGLVIDYILQKIPIRYIIDCLFIQYYKNFIGFIPKLAFNNNTSISTTIHLISVVKNILELKNYLRNINAKLAVFESEMGFVPSIFTILSDKYGIKSITMPHGYGYVYHDYTRTNLVIDYFLVQGDYYKKFFQLYNPNIKNYYPVGNIEIEGIKQATINNRELNKHIKKNCKVVTIFVVFTIFIAGHVSSWQRLRGKVFDVKDVRMGLIKLWRPFLEWVNSQDNLFLILKGKAGSKQYEHVLIKDLFSLISKEKYYQNDELPIRDLIDVSDCTICTGNSSTFYSTLCLGKPAISYNFFESGHVPPIGYDKHLVATNPEELISNLTYILKYGISETVYEKARKDHYAEGNLDFKAAERIKRLTKKIINN